MKNDLINIINNLNGNIFTLGIIDKDLINAIVNNQNISKYVMLNIKNPVEYEKNEKYKPTKKIKVKKIRKKNKRKKVDYTICEINDCKEHLVRLIDDTIYFTKNKIYYYGDLGEYDIDLLIKKYRRYNVIINISRYDDKYFILEIDVKKARTNKFKNFVYKVIDFFESLFDFLTNFLLS